MAFRIPLIVKMEMPDPAPLSGNCDVVNIWNGGGEVAINSVPLTKPQPAPTMTPAEATNNSNQPVLNSNGHIHSFPAI